MNLERLAAVEANLLLLPILYGRHKVARLMRLAGIRGCPQRRYKVTTQSDPSHPVASNLIKQDFSASAVNRRWAADITYSVPSPRKYPGRCN